MNLFQSVSVTATFAVLTANASGLVRIISDDVQKSTGPFDFLVSHGSIFFLVIFSILLRFKTCFDDHYYFEKRENGPNHNWALAGFILGLLAWATWIISGSLSYSVRSSAICLAITVSILTIWIVLHLIQLRYFPARGDVGVETAPTIGVRVGWFIINIFYISLLVILGLSLISSWIVLTGLFLILILDFGLSRSQIAAAGYER